MKNSTSRKSKLHFYIALTTLFFTVGCTTQADQKIDTSSTDETKQAISSLQKQVADLSLKMAQQQDLFNMALEDIKVMMQYNGKLDAENGQKHSNEVEISPTNDSSHESNSVSEIENELPTFAEEQGTSYTPEEKKSYMVLSERLNAPESRTMLTIEDITNSNEIQDLPEGLKKRIFGEITAKLSAGELDPELFFPNPPQEVETDTHQFEFANTTPEGENELH